MIGERYGVLAIGLILNTHHLDVYHAHLNSVVLSSLSLPAVLFYHVYHNTDVSTLILFILDVQRICISIYIHS